MRLRRSIAALFALCLLMTAFAAEAATTVYVKANSVKVYASASTSSKGMGTMNFGEAMGLVKRSGSWAKVMNTSGAVGYCKYSALTTKNPNGKAKTYYAKAEGIKAYFRTSTSSSPLETFSINDEVSVIAVTSDKKWFRVQLADSCGFIPSAQLSATKIEVPVTVYISSYTATAYQSKSTSSKNMGTMSFGQSLTRIKTEGAWARVQNAAGKIGYMKNTLLTTQDPNGTAETWYTTTSVTVRAMPSASAKKLDSLLQGESVDIVATTSDGKWARAELGSGYGYVEATKLTDDAPAPEETDSGYSDPNRGTASQAIERVIALAIQQYGKKYVYATSGPNTYDCSGLTCYCFSTAAGVSLKRSAYAQGYDGNFRKLTEIGALQRGDIVCFDTVSGDVDLSDHVGIYMGDGLFIHASSGAGKVIVSTLTSGYYNRQFSWGLRIFN